MSNYFFQTMLKKIYSTWKKVTMQKNDTSFEKKKKIKKMNKNKSMKKNTFRTSFTTKPMFFLQRKQKTGKLRMLKIKAFWLDRRVNF